MFQTLQGSMVGGRAQARSSVELSRQHLNAAGAAAFMAPSHPLRQLLRLDAKATLSLQDTLLHGQVGSGSAGRLDPSCAVSD